MPKWLQILLHVVLNAGTAYVAAQYPQYLPGVLAAAPAIQGALANTTYNTVPPPAPASK